MTDFQIGLTVMSAVVAAVSAFGFIWLRVEHAQARQQRRSHAIGQEFLPFEDKAIQPARIMEEATHAR